MGSLKRFRQGQILKLVAAGAVSSQDDLKRLLAQQNMRVTQATLSRDLQELRLVKTAAGYRPLTPETETAQPRFERAVREYLLDVREAQNLLVLRTPAGAAQPLAVALDRERLPEVVGTIGGDDTVLVITASRKACVDLRKRMQAILK
ncbi:MAG TPA: ArgR family transcriptional regulator [Terriglobia bacterium]|nr:ArgR family transcriptional regulator [Terriglobia bacterium]